LVAPDRGQPTANGIGFDVDFDFEGEPCVLLLKIFRRINQKEAKVRGEQQPPAV
jgi:hypothetical protein